MGHKWHELSGCNGKGQGAGHWPAEAAEAVHGAHGPASRNIRPWFHSVQSGLTSRQLDQGHQEGTGSTDHQRCQVLLELIDWLGWVRCGEMRLDDLILNCVVGSLRKQTRWIRWLCCGLPTPRGTAMWSSASMTQWRTFCPPWTGTSQRSLLPHSMPLPVFSRMFPSSMAAPRTLSSQVRL